MGIQNSSLEISKCLLVIQLKMLSGLLVSGMQERGYDCRDKFGSYQHNDIGKNR